eukprot:TRINITY_DN22950_c0_g1_i1.p1 TRINITY_DN22950_c0_g1~~TRINITY_DN22950_c0_g1_i1.p1  ORF type:complete len:189 (+),score=39.95 TRINITY_DN22950_c0_g1_i1:59-568(+)
MEEKYASEGMRRTAEAVMLVHRRGTPHVLMMQIGKFFKLPGGKIRPGEDTVEGLKRKLTRKLSPPIAGLGPEWEVGDLVATWWRPNFDQSFYPYLPPHITKPKECRKMFLVPLPESCQFAFPSNYKFKAVPLFDLYDNSDNYGREYAALPQQLSRFHFNHIDTIPYNES